MSTSHNVLLPFWTVPTAVTSSRCPSALLPVSSSQTGSAGTCANVCVSALGILTMPYFDDFVTVVPADATDLAGLSFEGSHDSFGWRWKQGPKFPPFKEHIQAIGRDVRTAVSRNTLVVRNTQERTDELVHRVEAFFGQGSFSATEAVQLARFCGRNFFGTCGRWRSALHGKLET